MTHFQPREELKNLESDPPGPPSSIDTNLLKSRAQLLQSQKAFNEAAHAWRQYLERHPKDAEAANELGQVLAALDCHDESLIWFRRSLLSKPNLRIAKINAGVALRRLQRYEEAISSFQELLRSNPDDPVSCFHLGASMHALKRDEEALKWCQRAHILQPGHFEAARELGDVLRALKRGPEAIQAYRLSLTLQPDCISGRSNLGSLLLDGRQFDEAQAEFQKVVALDPTDLGGWLNLGAALLGADRHADALAAYRRALVIQPACAAAYCNMALALMSLGRLDEGIEACRKAIFLEPGSAVATFNLGCLQLAAGNFQEGWENYESRRLEPGKKWAREDIGAAPWTGEPLHGKSILVLCEQGNGDQIQFARYVVALLDLGATVTFLIPKRLHRLFSTLSNRIALIDDAPGHFDFQCSLMSLPLCFERLRLPIPTLPYLFAEPDRIARWRNQIGDHGFRIGVVWQGNRYPSGDGFRPFPLSALRPLSKLPGVRLISLQINEGRDQIATLPAGMCIEDLGPDFDAGDDAFLDSAAVMNVLDLVVTCDTSLAHLAGALHRPVWIALNESPEWRWQRNRPDNIWYPTARLFRQSTRSDWDGVFSRMALELALIIEDQAALIANAADAIPKQAPHVAVSWGELIDKITILEIKSERLTSRAAIANVRRELKHLMSVASDPAVLSPKLLQRRRDLRAVNEKLWEIEDAIRSCEASRCFDDHFTELARSVYILNDERGKIKHAINTELKSLFVEEKQYRSY